MSDIPAAITDAVHDALVPRQIKRTVVAWLMALGLAVGWITAGAATCSCSGPQRPAGEVVAQVVTVLASAAKATCRAVESPAALALSEVVVPGVGPMAIGVARLACAVFVNDPRAPSVTVEVLADGSVRPQ